MEEKQNRLIKLLDKHYAKNPLARALMQIQIPPFGIFGIRAAADAYITTAITQYQIDRFESFIKELEKCDYTFSPDSLEEEKFIHYSTVILQAVLKTLNQEKIKLFAGLYANFISNIKYKPYDDYEEALQILEDLSYREFHVLLIIEDFVSQNPKMNEVIDDSPIYEKLQKELLERIEQETGIPEREIPGFLSRLERTGLYKNKIVSIIIVEVEDEMLTPNFYKFIELLGIDR